VRAERWLSEKGGHELVRVDLVHLPLHGASPLYVGKPAVLLLELSHRLRLLLLRRPLKLDLAVNLARRLEVNLKCQEKSS
jgi:hypothetical protein